jgi:branched-chain amino acid transport system permease protein
MVSPPRPKRTFQFGRWIRPAIGLLVIAFLAWRLWVVLHSQQVYEADTWMRFAISGVILGGVYAVIALGYTLVYGILFMINFAHGDVMMVGAFAGYFTLEALNGAGLLNRGIGWSILSILAAFIAGMLVAMLVAIALERIAYRPLRRAPRLVPLISAIGASIFLENAAQLMFGTARHDYTNPTILNRNVGWTIMVSGKEVLITYTGVLTFVLSILLMIGLYVLVQRTKMGKAMRAVAENKEIAALMGINVDRVIANTFAISGLLAGAAGVMWGLHMGIIYHFVGFVPGLKAFTAAVLGGIGSIPGAFVGALIMGQAEVMSAGYISTPMRDAIAFTILILVLLVRPMGIFGEPEREKA